MTVAFYISGHGFGHASRQVEVINALGALTGAHLLIRTAVSRALLERTLRVPFELDPGACDTGVIQSSSLAHDDTATVEAAMAFDQEYEHRAEAEVARMLSRSVELVVGDIPPLAFDVARRLGVPSVAIGNFTWDWIYETHEGFLPDGRAALERMRKAYRQATLALALPFATGFEVFPNVESLPLIARRSTQPRDEARRHFGLPIDGKVALLSFGGYGLPALNLTSVDCREDWTIVTTDRVSGDQGATAPHVRVLVERDALVDRFRYEDLVAAVDVVVTKPGYGIMAECASTGTAMLYTSRGQFREYDVLVGALEQLVRSRFISQTDLFAGRWRDALEALVVSPPPPRRLATDGADVAAHRIAALL